MTLSVDWANKIVLSTASITDLPAFKAAIRDLEDDAEGMLYPAVISYKRVDLGSGAYFHAVDLINGYTLKFPNAGNYTINGNLGGTIVPVSGVYVERKTSAAFATTSQGGTGPSAGDIAAAVWSKALEGAMTAEQMQRVLLAALGGKRQGLGTAIEQYMAQDGVTPRLTLTPDANGNGTPTLNGAP